MHTQHICDRKKLFNILPVVFLQNQQGMTMCTASKNKIKNDA